VVDDNILRLNKKESPLLEQQATVLALGNFSCLQTTVAY
jgi:hypothetical protein